MFVMYLDSPTAWYPGLSSCIIINIYWIYDIIKKFLKKKNFYSPTTYFFSTTTISALNENVSLVSNL